MPLETLFSNPLPSITRPSAILSRFTAPLATRNRNVSEFYVEPEDPWKSYFPGQAVRGCIVLTVSKSLPVTHLVVCLHGHARVYKNQVVPGDGVAPSGFLGPGRGTRGVEYLGNGFTSLFEDEVVLCGEGLLRKGVYKFKFELVFPMQGLPSSIDFERGTVSYFVTATLTRPTTIAPTSSCDRRIYFQDSIDIGSVALPKPQVISLEPISRRSMVKAKVKQPPVQRIQESAPAGAGKRIDMEPSSASTESSVDRPPPSPALSQISSTSAVTSSSQSFRIATQSHSTLGASGRNSESKSTSTSTSNKTITASTQLLKAGVLPGDVVPLRITITHTKPNLRGLVIVTLYREGRIDMHPLIPLGSRNKGKRPEYEDVYRRSRTGLGGLHFSNSSPSSVFRKDLSQTSTMMVVSPFTLASDVRASIKIPDDAFPTISNVPGGMIEFKYYLEVVIDLCGKLGESRFLPKISLTSAPPTFTHNNCNENGFQVTSNWADNILDTAQLRRGKNIVVCVFEVIVGSKDSARTWKKWPERSPQGSPRSSNIPTAESQWAEGEHHLAGDHNNPQHDYDGWHSDGQWIEGHDYAVGGQDDLPPAREGGYSDEAIWPDVHQPVPRFVLPPEPEEQVDEKTRLQRREALLLPSQPPDGADSASALCRLAPEATAPSAPFIPEEMGIHEQDGMAETATDLSVEHVHLSATSARSENTIVPAYSHWVQQPSLVNGDSSAFPSEDKQELERQRLMVQASAPPADGEGSAPGPSASIGAATAPALTEEDEYNAHTLNHIDEAVGSLPQYRR